MIQTATEAARAAGKVIVDRYPGRRQVTIKGYRDIVTDVDRAAESVVLDLIRERFPGHAILSEEAGGSGIGEGITWVVDPLDGTTNYAHRIPFFSVSIGVLDGGGPVAGVVRDPVREQTFAAERGGGSVLNGEAIRVSSTDHLRGAIVGFDWAHSDQVRAQVLALLQRIAPRCGTVRGFGSAALAQAYVAAGWLDAYMSLSLRPWDVAAGMLLVAEAGGRCSTVGGERCDPRHVSSFLVTNGAIHDELLAVAGGG